MGGKMKKKFLALLMVFLIGLVFASFPSVRAALSGDEGLTLSPPIKELTLSPGETSTQTLKLTNPTAKLVELYPKVMNFNAKGDSGEPGFTEANVENTKFSLASWITLTQSKVALTPEQVVEYQYTINVPQNAEPGGHYGVVFFATEPPTLEKDVSKVALSSMVGGLVLVRVPGDIKEEGQIESFDSDKLVYLFNNVKYTTRIRNLGNVHFKPLGTIKIKDLFGRTVDVLDFNANGGNILPESTRKWENGWKSSKILIGPVKATLNITYGSTSKPITESIWLWMIPWWLLVIIAVLVVALIAFLVYRKLKKKNKRTYDAPKMDKPEDQGQKYTQLG
jgi:hypothetical protein